MEKIRERFKQNKSSCESVRLRKRSSILYSTDDRRPQTLGENPELGFRFTLQPNVFQWEENNNK